MSIVSDAVQVLRRDGLIVYPTETVYGLGADALSEYAVHRVYEIKNRPMGKPISVAVSDEDMMAAIADVSDEAWEFIRTFLPGPVTVVLPVKSCLPSVLSGGTGKIGIRMPNNTVTREIIDELDAPITATSANLSGTPAPVTKEQVNVPYDLFIEGGELSGTPSTVVDFESRQILRPGDDIERIAAFFRTLE
ncbi:L-threonylcarbamoyladenylate synthase [Methanogenium organophilum]|uniref:L-threonylcarbamoyladenylate synthase n=1 Tax=Methanogenium organophilum TaxID=2199 RepID=A0A9X9S4I3_METOG|nr:L-threonylcarbamoyladenylate synthase [Methanogenium organophilum]WAI01335.1 L-threonylcarbamoyladenylate synthase [Methanogenium organophilum]